MNSAAGTEKTGCKPVLSGSNWQVLLDLCLHYAL